LNSNLQKKEEQNPLPDLPDFIVDCILEKKGKEIVKLDLRKLPEAVCDYFIICEGTSTTQVKAIGDYILYAAKKELNELPLQSEGFGNQEWILLDFFNVVVHIFLKERREFYRLEDLWSDGERCRYDEEGKVLTQSK